MLRTPGPPSPHSAGCLLLSSWLVPGDGRLCLQQLQEHISHSLERDSSPQFPLGKPWGCNVCSLLWPFSMQTTSLEWGEEGKSLAKVPEGECSHQRGATQSNRCRSRDAWPGEGCESSNIDFKMLHVYVQSEGEICPFLQELRLKVSRLFLIFLTA